MKTLRITTDEDIVIVYDELKKGEILQKEGSLLLCLEVNNECIKYEIHTDVREPDVDSIKKFIFEQVNAAQTGTHMLCITEYLKRRYIYIGCDDSRRQFTATKVV